MANLKEIRGRIKSIKSIQKVTSAMKMVAAAKLRTSQSNMEQCRPYSSKITTLLNDLQFITILLISAFSMLDSRINNILFFLQSS